MKVKKYITLSLVFAFILNAYSQDGTMKRASKIYDKLSYVKTSDILLEVAEKGYQSADLYQKLANSFYFNNKMEEASKWYGELFKLEEKIDAEY